MTILLIDLPYTGINLSDAIVMVCTIIGGSYAVIKGGKEIYRLGPKQASAKFRTWWTERRTRKMMWNTMLASQARIEKQLFGENGGPCLRDLLESGMAKLTDMGKNMRGIQARVQNQDDVSTTPIFRMDGRGNVTYTNAAFRDLIEIDESKAMFKQYLSRVRSSHRTQLEKEIDDSIRTLSPIDSTADFLCDGKGYVTLRLQATLDIEDIDGTVVVNAIFGTASVPKDGKNFLVDCPMVKE